MPGRADAGASRRHALIGTLGRSTAASAAMVVLYFTAPLDAGLLAVTFWLLAGLVLVGVLVTWQVRTIARATYPRLRAVEAACTTLPAFLLIFAAAHYELEQLKPGSYSQPMTRIDALYFVMTVFTTVGFGDITPVTQVARVVVMLQMLGDVIFIGLIARVLLGAVQTGLRRQRVEQAGPEGRPDDLGSGGAQEDVTPLE